MGDRAGVEEYACDCYRMVKEEFDRVTGSTRTIPVECRVIFLSRPHCR